MHALNVMVIFFQIWSHCGEMVTKKKKKKSAIIRQKRKRISQKKEFKLPSSINWLSIPAIEVCIFDGGKKAAEQMSVHVF